MADLLIKNLEMPKDGAFYVVVRPNGAYCYGRVKEGYIYHQVVEVKPHGRLIDAGELKNLIVWASTCNNGLTLNNILGLIGQAPTVLEAST